MVVVGLLFGVLLFELEEVVLLLLLNQGVAVAINRREVVHHFDALDAVGFFANSIGPVPSPVDRKVLHPPFHRVPVPIPSSIPTFLEALNRTTARLLIREQLVVENVADVGGRFARLRMNLGPPLAFPGPVCALLSSWTGIRENGHLGESRSRFRGGDLLLLAS